MDLTYSDEEFKKLQGEWFIKFGILPFRKNLFNNRGFITWPYMQVLVFYLDKAMVRSSLKKCLFVNHSPKTKGAPIWIIPYLAGLHDN